MSRVNHVHFTTNPCRLRLFTKEIVIFRDDIANKMRRHCFKPPIDDEDFEVTHHLVKTICDEAHLCPLPLNIQPIYWNYDQALWLNPLPDFLVLADRYDQYKHKYTGCIVFNPGSFPTDSSFAEFIPSQNEVQFFNIDPSDDAAEEPDGEFEYANEHA
jgi:DNA polymerase epsilon subunit 2